MKQAILSSVAIAYVPLPKEPKARIKQVWVKKPAKKVEIEKTFDIWKIIKALSYPD